MTGFIWLPVSGSIDLSLCKVDKMITIFLLFETYETNAAELLNPNLLEYCCLSTIETKSNGKTLIIVFYYTNKLNFIFP